MYLAVKFLGSDPTKGAFDQWPLEVLEISGPLEVPVSGGWVLMTRPSLTEYISRVEQFYEPLRLSTKVNIAEKKVKRAIEFGQTVIISAAAQNIVLRLTPSQIIHLITRCAGVMGMLQSGALVTSLLALKNMAPDTIVTQARIDNIITQIEKYLSEGE